jgi:hypothetical protein
MTPDLPILVCSGHDIDAALGDNQGIPGVATLKKPYRMEDLRRMLSELLRPRAPTA